MNLIIGWDVSTSVVGYSIFEILEDKSFKWISSNYVSFKDIETLMEKCSIFEDSVEILVHDILNIEDKVCYNFVEDKLCGFSGGFTNAGTMMKLGAFNLTCSYILSKIFSDSKVVHIHPTTVKSKVGLKVPKGGNKKKLTVDLVKSREPNFKIDLTRNGTYKDYVYDMCDSYIVGLAGILAKMI